LRCARWLCEVRASRSCVQARTPASSTLMKQLPSRPIYAAVLMFPDNLHARQESNVGPAAWAQHGCSGNPVDCIPQPFDLVGEPGCCQARSKQVREVAFEVLDVAQRMSVGILISRLHHRLRNGQFYRRHPPSFTDANAETVIAQASDLNQR
jgi:hypothetical protein